MLSEGDLKQWLHKDFGQLDRLLLILATFDSPIKLDGLRERAARAGLKLTKSWNLSAVLGRSKGLAIRVPDGWEITNAGKNHLRSLGVSNLSPSAVQVASDLRAHLEKIQNETTRAFVDEAIRCHEGELYRSAIVMSWLAAVDVLQRTVVSKHLPAFNASAKTLDSKWKDAFNEDGLGKMGEERFLERCAAIGMLGKNQKDELLKGLKLRNGCGHPNSLKIGPNAVANHIEILLLNVFEPFAV
ncbi:hypothetical protein DC429_11085 [Arthrobacter sp. TPD3018]|uniref:hypothetical protein n=1 Tax=Bacteria TaxID=2 RepID=UPI000D50D0AA|nr:MULTISPECIES: hypothetical protein [Bacteria]PVE55865.1 hypothetical protein DC425_11075 [Sphingomonas sp. TPD3009]PVE57606.1 hypothetical protein DC429_11085 [Arthrobacter sp. TPD3018]PVE83231.1 hypothetical protein DC431_11075 [Sphingomonas melonis]